MQTPRALIVDDSEISRLLIAAILHRNYPAWEVVEAAAAAAALRVLGGEGGRFDALFVDLTLPGVGGLELARRARQLLPGASICLLTSNPADTLRQGAQRIGVDLLRKPIKEEAVVEYLVPLSGRD